MRRTVLAFSLWLLAAAAPGCFNPDHPACAFSCLSPPHTCPSGFTCGADNLCHDPTSTAICAIVPTDAAPADATGALDAAVDSAGDHAGQ